MSLRFQVFRQILCILLSLLAGSSLCLGIYLSNFFYRQGIPWTVISVEVLSFLRSSFSAVRKPLFASPQSVASEAVGLFVLFPFHLIVTLFLSSTLKLRPNMPLAILLALRILAIACGLIHIVYTFLLVTIAMLTVPAFDADVWLRDLDSSPSPFPLPIIFGYALPRIARLFEATRPFVRESMHPPGLPPPQCLPTCPPDCVIHGVIREIIPKPAETSTEGPTPAKAEGATLPTQEIKRPPILPHTLIRIPNAAERRNSIYVDLNLRH